MLFPFLGQRVFSAAAAQISGTAEIAAGLTESASIPAVRSVQSFFQSCMISKFLSMYKKAMPHPSCNAALPLLYHFQVSISEETLPGSETSERCGQKQAVVHVHLIQHI